MSEIRKIWMWNLRKLGALILTGAVTLFMTETVDISGLQQNITNDSSVMENAVTDDDVERNIRNLVGTQTKEKLSKTATPVEDFTYRIDQDYAVIEKYNGRDTQVEIPNVIEGRYVGAIADDAFTDNLYLEKVVMPDTIVYIGSRAFMNCTKLTEVELPAMLITLCSRAFEGCTSLKTVTRRTAEDGENYSIRTIESAAFKNCTALEAIDLSGDIFQKVSIGDNAFENCISLQQVVMPQNIYAIGGSAFKGCISLLSVDLYNVVDIRSEAFRGCTGLTEVTIPGTVSGVGWSAFADCTSLASVTLLGRELSPIEEGVAIDSYAFANTAISEITVPGFYGYIGSYCFESCPNLTKFVWEDSNKNVADQSMGDNVFADSMNLVEVHLPLTVNYIRGWDVSRTGTPVIYAPEGSVAHAFAVEKGISFVAE